MFAVISPSPSLPLFFSRSFSPTLFLTLALPVSVLSFISHSFSLTHSLSHSYPNSIHFFLFFFLLLFLFLSSLISLTFFFPLFLSLTISPFLSHSLPFSQQNENEEENLNTSPTKVSPNEKKMFFHQSQKFSSKKMEFCFSFSHQKISCLPQKTSCDRIEELTDVQVVAQSKQWQGLAVGSSPGSNR